VGRGVGSGALVLLRRAGSSDLPWTSSFLERVGEVGFDGAAGDVELFGDFAVVVAVGGEGGDAVLCGC
jgi:hypothetical protein